MTENNAQSFDCVLLRHYLIRSCAPRKSCIVHLVRHISRIQRLQNKDSCTDLL
jgi:hypothetical protein